VRVRVRVLAEAEQQQQRFRRLVKAAVLQCSRHCRKRWTFRLRSPLELKVGRGLTHSPWINVRHRSSLPQAALVAAAVAVRPD